MKYHSRESQFQSCACPRFTERRVWLALLLRIRKFAAQNLGPEIGYPD
jgi:hypothetical protein